MQLTVIDMLGWTGLTLYSAYRRAAEQGYYPAQRAPGSMYYRGEGVPTDDVQYYTWTSLAEAQGGEESREAKEALTSVMTTELIAEAQKLSGEYWELYGPSKGGKKVWDYFHH